MRSRKRGRELESDDSDVGSDKENSSSSSKKGSNAKRHHKIPRKSKGSDLRDDIINILTEDSHRRAKFENDVRDLMKESIQDSREARQEFLSLLKQ